MGSRVLDGAVVGELALVGAGALVPEGMRVPARTLVVGVPARVVRYVCPRSLRHRVAVAASVPRCSECGDELRAIVSPR
jgi:carbonic anhydrase/acetyltransferase-like protein (isoleucine patch superfamily)